MAKRFIGVYGGKYHNEEMQWKIKLLLCDIVGGNMLQTLSSESSKGYKKKNLILNDW